MILPTNSNSILKAIPGQPSSIVIIPTDGSHKAYLISQLHKKIKTPFVIVLKDVQKASSLIEELNFFLPEKEDQIFYYPAYPALSEKNASYQKEISIKRLSVLSKFIQPQIVPPIVVTTVDAVLQKLIPKDSLNKFAELIIVNEEIDRENLILKLESGGYLRTMLVEDPGEYSVRGSIIDIFCPGNSHPVRIEFFGDLVESIRYFSPYTQRGFKDIFEFVLNPSNEAVIPKEEVPHILARLREKAALAGLDAKKIREYANLIRETGKFPGMETSLPIIYEKLDPFFNYISSSAFWILDDPGELESAAGEAARKANEQFRMAISEGHLCVNPETSLLEWNQGLSEILSRHHTMFQPVELSRFKSISGTCCLLFAYQDNLVLSSKLRREGFKENPLMPLAEWLKQYQAGHVFCVMTQESQAKRLVSMLQPYGIAPLPIKSFDEAMRKSPGVYYVFGELSSGFVLKDDAIAIVSENEIFDRKRIRRQGRGNKDLKTELIAPEELKNGDIVVHTEHGIGRYEGLCSLKIDRLVQDFILIVYQDDDKLYLPVDRIEMIGKYVGVEGYTPILDKIGSKTWIKSKAKAKEEVEKLAAELLQLYAQRKTNTGFSFSRPDNYYNDFEASFPYEETRDQLKAIDDVQLDMESSVPMDRLVCGDVGYGKTEVAVRAAFKAVNDGKQVAIVVPTTILAEQHLSTFRDRFSGYPVSIECLSRFRSPKDQARILKEIRSGIVDIVIGTHRLLQKDVDFKCLGLLVIDEEQRFGVKHKEALKKKRAVVDVLALTATPIPRTLHLSLTGMRDISVIKTPPADRQPIISYISKYDASVVKEAIKKELFRNGQVFYVHNNIKTILKTAENIAELVPEAKIGIAHGRLSEKELEEVMLRFINLEVNVLVCTTIIESGLDIPSANTMIIDKTENFGLSQIYQLRGRIGRGDHQAYAYLFISDESQLTKDAKKRLAALMEFKDLGSGFQIAMKDLQIRGAGTALGASQSGHIAAVGYDMFLKLLDQAVYDLKGENVIEPLEPEINVAMSSGFPEYYIESVEQRLTVYRRLSRITEVSELGEIKKELADRYGKLPKEAENMLLKIMLRVYCIQAGIKRLDMTPEFLTLSFSEQHQKHSIDGLIQYLNHHHSYEFIKKDSVRITLGPNRGNISKALLEARNILKSFA